MLPPIAAQPGCEYKVIVYREPLLGSILLGEAATNPLRFTEFLNENARAGWRVVTMSRENRREFWFFRREAFIVILERPVMGGGTAA